MDIDGIEVLELGLNLPHTCYYLEWAPLTGDTQTARRAAVARLRHAGRQSGWQLLAVGSEPARVYALFATDRSGPVSGLEILAVTPRNHRLYLVQPGAALQQVARFIHERQDAGRHPTARAASRCIDLPAPQYGLFMGEAAWAERILGVLTRCASAAVRTPKPRHSLAGIADAHPDTASAICAAYCLAGYTLKDIAEFFGMHFSEVSAVINASTVRKPGEPPRHGT